MWIFFNAYIYTLPLQLEKKKCGNEIQAKAPNLAN